MLAASAMVATGAAYAGPALPVGGSVASGTATIGTPANGSLTITQSSDRAIVNWNSFSIGQGGTVNFDNGSGATLNRVTGSASSAINGALNATGSVYLINPNGVVIGKTGVVNVGKNFVASTLGVSNAQFNAGGALTLSGNSQATVVNYGRIGSLGGDVALVARTVTNTGTISAAKGSAGLLAGSQVALRDSALDDGKFSVDVGNSGDSATNSGSIVAADAELRANDGNVYALAGNTSGVIAATGTSSSGGKIFLTAGDGDVQISGTIAARNADGSGGSVVARGTDISVGGTIDTSAMTSGKSGGSISVIGTGNTSVLGTIEARGNNAVGGTVETSGHALSVGGARVDAGDGGLWLLDPYDLTADAAAATTIDNTLNAGTSVTLKTTAAGATGPGIQNAAGNGDIFIESALSWNTAATLTLDAYRSVNVLAPVTVAGTGDVVLTTDDGGSGGSLGFGLSGAGFAGAINYTGTPNAGQSLKINGTSYTLLYSMSDVQNINNNLGGTFALAQSLDATGQGWTPLGTDGAGNIRNGGLGFSGTFEGLGHTISNLNIGLPVTFVGLFGASSGSVVDIGVVGGSESDGNLVGALVGVNLNSGLINNAYATGPVSSKKTEIGGLVGENDGTISNAFATGPVNGGVQDVGGLVGASVGTIVNSYATGPVADDTSQATSVGGLVGLSRGLINNSYATGNVDVTGYHTDSVGGLVGKMDIGVIENSYATGAVSTVTTNFTPPYGISQDVGGLIGFAFAGTVANVYSTGNVGAGLESSAVGGLVGDFYQGSLTGAYATGNVNIAYSEGSIGGLIGVSSVPVTNVYATGSITIQAHSDLNNYVGELIGFASDTSSLTDSFAMGGPAGPVIGNGSGANGANGVYWDSTTDGIPGGLTTAQLSAALPAGFDPSVWGNDHNQTTPYLLGLSGPVYVGNGSAGIFHVVQTAGDLEAINNNLTGDYRVVNNIDASATSGWNSGAGFVPIGTDGAGTVENSGNGFSGTFNGQGFTISGLAVNRLGTDYIGLFGYSSGTIQNIGIAGGTISGHEFVGGLAGESTGTISNVFTTNAVTGNEGVAGLVGYNFGGSITDAYETGAVSGTFATVGGIAGNNNTGTITNAFATGAVSAPQYVGGLVGADGSGVVADAYSTGAVSGLTNGGGLVGNAFNSTTITNSYWDTGTSGQAASAGGTGKTTAQLQGTLPTGFSGAVWGTGTGLYPYLTHFYPGGQQVVSGTAYASTAATVPLASNANGAITVGLDASGNYVGQATTGANGYYYIAVPAGTIATGNVLSYVASGAPAAAELAALTNTVSQTGINVHGNALAATTNATTLTGLRAIVAATAANDAAGLSSANNAAGLDLAATGPSFTVDVPLTIANGANLILNASGALAIDAPITISGTSQVVFSTGAYDNATGLPSNTFANFSFGQGDDVNFGTVNHGSALTLNGTSYTLIYSLAALQGTTGGNAALATPLDATGVSWTPVAFANGTFEGLGNTVSNLTVTTGIGPGYAGLFGSFFNSTLRDLGVTAGNISGGVSDTGALVGLATNSLFYRDWSTASVTGPALEEGGLIGAISGGTVARSYATGTVTDNAYGDAGGLVGSASGGLIVLSYATGSVQGGGSNNNSVGGLVGADTSTAIGYSYATGSVSSSARAAGGLAGTVTATGATSLMDDYATGPVGGTQIAGGLVGDALAFGALTIADSYSIGAVNAPTAGGFIGTTQTTPVTIADDFWDTSTSGRLTSGGSGGTGLTTAQLQSVLPGTFSSAIWGTGTGLFPYLKAFDPNGVQAVSGFAYSDAGVSPLGGGVTIGLDGGGAFVGSATTGADGYYYVAMPAGTLASGANMLAYVVSGAPAAAEYASLTNTTAQTGLNLYQGFLAQVTSATSLSASGLNPATYRSNAISAAGSDSAGLAAVNSLSSGILATGGSFTVDQPLTVSYPLTIETAAASAPLTVSAPITLNGANALTLNTSGALAINAAISVTGAGSVTLDTGFDTTSVPGAALPELSFGSGDITFGSTNNGATLSINNTPYTLLYSASDIEGINADALLSGNYALANSIDATGVSGWVPVGLNASGQAQNGGLGFAGTFEGLGNTVSHLTVNAMPTGNAAMFGYTSGTIRDLNLANVTINATNAGAGLATATSGALINDTVSGTIHGGSYVGGLVGQSKAGTVIVDGSSSATVTGTTGRIGGIAGWNAAGATILDSRASGHVTGFDQTGGLVGWNDGTIRYSSASGEVTGTDYAAGGLVGYDTAAAILSSVDATGTVDGTAGGEGGLVGYNLGTITNAYATGNVGIATTHTVGGLIGNNAGGSVSDVYASGNVTGAATKGALMGTTAAATTVSNAYYVALSGTLVPIGTNYNPSVHPVALNAGLPPTAEASYAGFDFSAIWMIAPGQMPTLRNVP